MKLQNNPQHYENYIRNNNQTLSIGSMWYNDLALLSLIDEQSLTPHFMYGFNSHVPLI